MGKKNRKNKNKKQVVVGGSGSGQGGGNPAENSTLDSVISIKTMGSYSDKKKISTSSDKPQEQQQEQQERGLYSIERYNSRRDGEAVGILLADGLMEMFPPLFVEILFHPKVISFLVALEGFLIPLGPRLTETATTTTTNPFGSNFTTGTTTISNLSVVDTLMSSSWFISAMILPTLLVLISSVVFLLMVFVRIHLRWSKKTRIETSFTPSSSSSTTTNSSVERDIIGQWVVRQSRRQSQQETGEEEEGATPLGCVTLYREEEEVDNNNNNNSMDDNQNRSKLVYWISHLTIAPSLRRQGWGTKLALQAETKAREMGATSIRILVGNVKSKPFWVQRGYKVLYPKWTLLGHESIYMELDLMETKNDKNNGVVVVGGGAFISSNSTGRLIDVSVQGNPKYKGNMIWVSTRSQAMFLN